MSLRPLTPQSPARIEWEQAVCLAIEHKIECTTSDAQSIMEAQADRLDSLYLLRTVADIAAIKLLQDPAVHPDEAAAQAEQSGLDILNAEGFKLLDAASDATDAKAEAIANADAHLNNAGMVTYSELLRRNGHAVCSLGEAREQRDAFVALLRETLQPGAYGLGSTLAQRIEAAIAGFLL